jgi:hypothetical protein
MEEKQGLLIRGWRMVARNKRYIAWFYALNLLLGLFSTVTVFRHARAVLDHSLHADRLLHGFSLGVLEEMLMRPEFGSTWAPRWADVYLAVPFFLATALFLPGVLQGYASTYRLPREDFFRACGRNLWRFIRLMIVAGVVMGSVADVFYGLRAGVESKAAESTNELLLPGVQLAELVVVFLVMAVLRIWFDLAQADVVLSDERAVRNSISVALRHTWLHLGRLLVSYVVTTIAAVLVLAAGLLVWMKFVRPDDIAGAIVVGQVTLLLLLIPRFWQRGVAVTYYQQNMVQPIAVQSFAAVIETPAVSEPVPAAAILSADGSQ